MSAESTLYSTLNSDATVLSLIGVTGASPAEARAYPDVVPEGSDLPAIAYQRISTEYVQTVDGASPVGETATLEVTCVAKTRTSADNVADAVQNAAGPAGFYLVERGSQQVEDQQLWATTLTMSINLIF